MKTWCTKYGYPETREEVEHEEDDCPACVFAGPVPDGGVLFVTIEKNDGSTIIRRVEGMETFVDALSVSEYGIAWTANAVPMVGCRIVSQETADQEIADALRDGRYKGDEHGAQKT